MLHVSSRSSTCGDQVCRGADRIRHQRPVEAGVMVRVGDLEKPLALLVQGRPPDHLAAHRVEAGKEPADLTETRITMAGKEEEA